MRRFLRHPTDIPIEVHTLASKGNIHDGKNHTECCSMTSISQGGFSCEVENYLTVGSIVEIDILSITPKYHGKGEVVWCKAKDRHFEVGVCFTDVREAFKSRMVQQVCQIEHYKNIVYEREGRILDGNEAAAEWIQKHAADFAQ